MTTVRFGAAMAMFASFISGCAAPLPSPKEAESAASRPFAPKTSPRQVAEVLLKAGPADVYFDPRETDVLVPEQFKNDSRVVFKLGAVSDLIVDDNGFSGTLSFDSKPFHCNVPWSRVFAVVNDDGKVMVWEDRIPFAAKRDAAAGGG